jgi:heme-degrading monooxygenase HmoA
MLAACPKLGSMVLEIAQIDVTPGMNAQFEDGVRKARPVILNSPGCLGVTLYHSIEQPQRYRFMLQWQTLEHHTVEFRGSAAFQIWRGLVSHFFAQPPSIEHHEIVEIS